ncbi:MAG: hypothetical protein KatS3mg057_0914 [Herpetosiphonaceae bacterium]|nr:MAG: hypothetical protein KatS3mg057_0914 [Herpetosiphonaceae bacterium]
MSATRSSPWALHLNLPIRSLQHFIGQSTWATAPLIAQHQALVGTTLGEPDGRLPGRTNVASSNKGTIRWAWPRSTVGRSARSPTARWASFWAYASRKGYPLLAGQLCVPDVWFPDDHADQRTATGRPATLTAQSKPEIALRLLQQAVARRCLPARWLTADAWYGNSPAFRDGGRRAGALVHDRHLDRYAGVAPPAGHCAPAVSWERAQAHAVPAEDGEPLPLSRRPPAEATAENRVDANDDHRGKPGADHGGCRGGAGDGARDGLPGPRLWLLIRRSLRDPSDGRYYLSNAPEETPTAELVWMLGMRWTVELAFAQGKQEVGMDAYEVRSWQGWHQHMLLMMLAHHFLVWVRVQWQDKAPALTLYQVRLLVRSVLPVPVLDAARALKLVL